MRLSQNFSFAQQASSSLIRLKSIFKNFTTKAKKAHEGGIKPENLVLRVPLRLGGLYPSSRLFFLSGHLA
jgi:hypothetical protein